jgi:hypothetical protein
VNYDDYYVAASTPELDQTYERHAGLRRSEAEDLRRALLRLQAEGLITDVVVDHSEPEWYTVGFADTLGAVKEQLGLYDEEDDEDDAPTP